MAGHRGSNKKDGQAKKPPVKIEATFKNDENDICTANSSDVKCYKMSPEEIDARYGKAKRGSYVSVIKMPVNPRAQVKEEDVMLSKDQVLVEIRKLMDELGCVDHMPNIKEITKKSKSLEKDMYFHFGSVNTVADELGIMPYAKYKAAEKVKVGKASATKSKKKPAKIEPIEDVSEERFEEAYAAVHPEPEVMTVTADASIESFESVDTAENILTEVDEPEVMTELKSNDAIFDTYSHKVADYEKLALNIIDCMKIEQELRQRQEELNIWLEGFEKAAELMGVDLG